MRNILLLLLGSASITLLSYTCFLNEGEQIKKNVVMQNVAMQENKFPTNLYRTSAIKLLNGTVTLKGSVPSEQIHRKLIVEAEKIFGKNNVVDKLKENKGEPINWYKTIKLGFEKLNVVDNGTFNLMGKHFIFKANVDTQEKKNILIANFKSSLDAFYESQYHINIINQELELNIEGDNKWMKYSSRY